MIWANPGGLVGDLSGGVRTREITKYDAERRYRRPRVQKQVRNVSSDVPVTLYGDWRHINEIFGKSPKTDYIFKK